MTNDGNEGVLTSLFISVILRPNVNLMLSREKKMYLFIVHFKLCINSFLQKNLLQRSLFR